MEARGAMGRYRRPVTSGCWLPRLVPAVLGGLLGGCTGAPSHTPESARPPDVLLVVLDTVRADRLSTYGAARITDPNLAAFAAQGVVFEDVTSPGSWTWPAHASLFTGLPPWTHGARTRSEPPPGVAPGTPGAQVTPMRTDVPTVAERFAAAGYHTVALSQNAWLDAELGLTRGFSRVEVTASCPGIEAALASALADERPSFVVLNYMPAHAPYQVAPVPWLAPDALTGPDAPAWVAPFVDTSGAAPALDLYRSAASAPDGGFVAAMRGELELDRPLLTDLYDAGVRTADHCMGRAVAQWSAAGRSGIVAVTADHGEYLGEHGLWEHGQTLWGPLTRVPLVVVAPGRLDAGRRVAAPVQLQDVPGTLLALAGLEPLGRSLVSAAQGEPLPPRPIQAASWMHPQPAAEIGGPFARDWRLYREGDRAVLIGEGEPPRLYDTSADPLLLVDRAAEEPAVAARLAKAAADAFPEVAATGSVSLSDDLADQLGALGYVDAPAPPPEP